MSGRAFLTEVEEGSEHVPLHIPCSLHSLLGSSLGLERNERKADVERWDGSFYVLPLSSFDLFCVCTQYWGWNPGPRACKTSSSEPHCWLIRSLAHSFSKYYA